MSETIKIAFCVLNGARGFSLRRMEKQWLEEKNTPRRVFRVMGGKQ